MKKFVVIDYISHNQVSYMLIIQVKKVSFGEVRKQCILALMNMRDCNGRYAVYYGFVTMGNFWRIVLYDSTFMIS